MGAKPRRALPTIPRCRDRNTGKSYNYHVFGLGADRCSCCGWNRYPDPSRVENPNHPDVAAAKLAAKKLGLLG